MERRHLRAGLIGFGMIGKAHAFGYATLPYYAPDLGVVGRIVGVATSREETAQKARDTIGCDFYTTDPLRIAEDPEIDVVHICTPNAEHLPALLAAIKHNKHIYCEKPVVSNRAEAAQLREATSRAGTNGRPAYLGISQTAFHLRGFTAIRRAKELVDEGRLGQIVQYRVGYYHASMLSPTGPFRWKHAEHGGSILDLASHLVDLVDYLVGLPNEVMAQTTTLCATRPVRALKSNESLEAVESRAVLAEDSVSILTRGLDAASSRRTIPARPSDVVFEYPRNARGAEPGFMPLAVANPRDPAAITGIIEATKLVNGAEDELRLEINGTRGSIRFNLMDSHYLEYFDATRPSETNGGNYGWTRIACGGRYGSPDSDFPSPKSTTGWIRAHAASLSLFYRSIESGRALGADLEQALRVQDALETIKESAKERAWLTVRS